MSINSFLRIWSKKINNFFEIHPKINYSNVVNENQKPLGSNFELIKGIKNTSIEGLKQFIGKYYIADVLTTKLVKEKIDELDFRYTDSKVFGKSGSIEYVLYDFLNFFKNKNKIYTTYFSAYKKSDDYERVSNILTNDDEIIEMKCDLTYKESEIMYDNTIYSKLMLKSNTPVSVNTTIDLNVDIVDDSFLNNKVVLLYDFRFGSLVVYNNEIHILGGIGGSQNHYKWNGAFWVSVSTLPYEFHNGSAVVYNNEIHIFGDAEHNNRHSKWNGNEWIEDISELPYNFTRGCATVFENEIHILGSTSINGYKAHYKLIDSHWVKVSELPYDFSDGSVVTLNDGIHILGGTACPRLHSKWNGAEWIEDVSELPYNFYSGTAIEFNNEIHILGGANNNVLSCYYKYNGETWEKLSSLPINFQYDFAFIFNNRINILGIDNINEEHFFMYKNLLDSWNNYTTSNLYFGYRIADDRNGRLLTATDLCITDDFVKLFRITDTFSFSDSIQNYCSIMGMDCPTDDVYLCFYIECNDLELIDENETHKYLTVRITIE